MLCVPIRIEDRPMIKKTPKPYPKTNLNILSHKSNSWKSDMNKYCFMYHCVENRKDFPKLSLFASWTVAMINPQWLELPMSRTNFHGPKDVRAIEVRLYVSLTSGVKLYIHLWNVVVRVIFASILQSILEFFGSILESPLDFEITRVDCIWAFGVCLQHH